MAAFDNSSFNLVLPRFQGSKVYRNCPRNAGFPALAFHFSSTLKWDWSSLPQDLNFSSCQLHCHGPKGNFTGNNKNCPVPLDSWRQLCYDGMVVKLEIQILWPRWLVMLWGVAEIENQPTAYCHIWIVFNVWAACGWTFQDPSQGQKLFPVYKAYEYFMLSTLYMYINTASEYTKDHNYIWTMEKDMKTWLVIAVTHTTYVVVKLKPEKIQAWTGIELMTPAILVQCSINWAIKPTESRSCCEFVIRVYP